MKSRMPDQILADVGPSGWYETDLGMIKFRCYWEEHSIRGSEVLVNAPPKSYLVRNTLFVWIPSLILPTWYNIETMEPDEQFSVLKRTTNYTPFIRTTTLHVGLPPYLHLAKGWRIYYKLPIKNSQVPLTLPERVLRDKEVRRFKHIFVSATKRCPSPGTTQEILKELLRKCF